MERLNYRRFVFVPGNDECKECRNGVGNSPEQRPPRQATTIEICCAISSRPLHHHHNALDPFAYYFLGRIPSLLPSSPFGPSTSSYKFPTSAAARQTNRRTTYLPFIMANPLDTDAGSELFSSYESELKLVQADLNQKLDQITELSGEPRKSAVRLAERSLEEANELVCHSIPPQAPQLCYQGVNTNAST